MGILFKGKITYLGCTLCASRLDCRVGMAVIEKSILKCYTNDNERYQFVLSVLAGKPCWLARRAGWLIFLIISSFVCQQKGDICITYYSFSMCISMSIFKVNFIFYFFQTSKIYIEYSFTRCYEQSSQISTLNNILGSLLVCEWSIYAQT